MAKKGPPRRLFKSGDSVSPYKADRSARGRMKQMSRDHQDVLQNIEFVLITGHRKDPQDRRSNGGRGPGRGLERG